MASMDAWANAMAQLGQEYGQLSREKRQREQHLADVASQRDYNDKVRQDTFDKELSLAQKRADIELKKQIDYIRKAEPAQVLAKAEAMGVPTTNIDGSPRNVADVRADTISRTQAESAQAAVADARAKVAAAGDEQVLAGQKAIDLQNKQNAIDNEKALVKPKQDLLDEQNARSADVLQQQLTANSNQLAPLMLKLQSDPALQAVVQAGGRIAKDLEAKVGTGPMKEKTLRAAGIPVADYDAAVSSGDVSRLTSVATRLGIQVDTTGIANMAQAQIAAAALIIQPLGQIMREHADILKDARDRGIMLKLPDGTPALPEHRDAPAAAAPSALVLPGSTPAPAQAQVSTTAAPGAGFFNPAATPVANTMQPSGGFTEAQLADQRGPLGNWFVNRYKELDRARKEPELALAAQAHVYQQAHPNEDLPRWVQHWAPKYVPPAASSVDQSSIPVASPYAYMAP